MKKVSNKIMLITYADCMGHDLKDLNTVLDKYLDGAVYGLHILPFFPSSADRGFAPTTYDIVDPQFGDWDDMKKLSEKYYLMYDYMINHISAHSEIYHDFLEKKDASEYRDFFIRFKDFWKNGEPTEEQISKIYLRKEQPYIEAEFADGTKEKLWCTFSPEQIDINCLGSEKAKEYLEEKLKFLSDHGASLIRLDALAYASKREDTNCFFVEPEIWKIVDQCEKALEGTDSEILPEIHENYFIQKKLEEKNVYTYGPIIHNTEVVNELESKGVKAVNDISEIPEPEKSTVIIRSHGVSKAVYESIKNSGAKIVDATCPFVLKIHKIVKDASAEGDQIVIIGNEKHPEVEGIMGWSETPVHVVDTVEKAEKLKLDKSKNVRVVSQTTFNYKKFQDLVEIIKKKEYNICISNTICNATEERQNEARRIARRADAMIVIGDSSSSNTRKLYEICKTECQETFYIQTLSGLELDKLKSSDCIGITAGASTPNNIIEEVYTNVRRKLCTDVR